MNIKRLRFNCILSIGIMEDKIFKKYSLYINIYIYNKKYTIAIHIDTCNIRKYSLKAMTYVSSCHVLLKHMQ